MINMNWALRVKRRLHADTLLPYNCFPFLLTGVLSQHGSNGMVFDSSFVVKIRENEDI